MAADRQRGVVDDRAGQSVQEATGQARERAQEVAGEARGRIQEQVDQRTTKAADQVGSMVENLRSVAEELRKQDKGGPASFADQAATKVERFGSYLRDSDSQRMLDDVEDFARRQPWAVVAGGIAVGFLASRLLKASSGERYQSRTASGDYTSTSSRAGLRSELRRTYGATTSGLAQTTEGAGAPHEATTGVETYGGGVAGQAVPPIGTDPVPADPFASPSAAPPAPGEDALTLDDEDPPTRDFEDERYRGTAL
ncbi:MAG: hypothetical protein ABR529_14595 [Actinomycetota bacterium]